MEAISPVSRLLATSGTGTLKIPTPAAFALNKSLTFSRRHDPAKSEKDLYYLFYVVAMFPDWHDSIGASLRTIAGDRPSWVKSAMANVERVSADVESAGIASIARQRPSGAFVGLDEDQFRQYALSVLGTWFEILRGALDGASR